MAKTTSKPREFLSIGVPAFGHRYGVEGVAFTRDGKTLLISGGKETRLVDVQSAQTISTLKQGGPIVLLKNETLLMIGPSLANNEMFGSVTVQDIATKKKLFSFDSCTCAALAPDENLMAFGNYKKITLTTLNPVKELATIEVESDDHGMIESLAFSHDGKYLASGGVHAGGTKDVFIWKVNGETLTHLHSLHVTEGRVDTLAFTPDDKTLLIGSSALLVWNFEENIVKEIPLNQGQRSGNLQCLTISEDGNLIAGGSQDSTIRAWKADDYSEIVCLQPDDKDSWIKAVAFSPDGKIIAGGGSNARVSMIDTASGEDCEFGTKHTGTIMHLAGNSERLFSSGYDHTLRAWNLKSGAQEAVVSSEFGLALSPDGKQLIHGGPNGSLIIRETSGDLPIVKTLERHRAAVSDICWSTDGTLIVSGGWDATIREWCPDKGEILTITPDNEHELDYDPDADHSKKSKKSKGADDDDDSDYSNNSDDYDLPGHDEYCTEDCDIHRTPEIKTVDEKDIDLNSESDYLTDEGIVKVALSYDNRWIASIACFDSYISLWHADTGKTSGAVTAFEAPTGLSFARKSPRCAVSSTEDATVALYDFSSNGFVQLFEFKHSSNEVALSDNGELLASSGDDGSIIVWNTSSGKKQFDLDVGGAQIFALEFLADNKLVAATEFGAIFGWEL